MTVSVNCLVPIQNDFVSLVNTITGCKITLIKPARNIQFFLPIYHFFTIFIMHNVNLHPNLTVQKEGVPLTQGIRIIKTFKSESAAANKVTSKYEKWFQVLEPFSEMENNKSGKSYSLLYHWYFQIKLLLIMILQMKL